MFRHLHMLPTVPRDDGNMVLKFIGIVNKAFIGRLQPSQLSAQARGPVSLLRKDSIRKSPDFLIPLQCPILISILIHTTINLCFLPLHPQAAQALKNPPRAINLRSHGDCLCPDAVEVVLHHLNRRLARLVRPVLVESVVGVDEERAQIRHLGLGVGGAAGEDASELEEVEEERFRKALELEGAVVVFCVAGCGGERGGEVCDSLFF